MRMFNEKFIDSSYFQKTTDALMRVFYTDGKAEKEIIKPGGENVYIAGGEKVILKYSSVKKSCFWCI